MTCGVNLHGRWGSASITISTTNSTKFLHKSILFTLWCFYASHTWGFGSYAPSLQWYCHSKRWIKLLHNHLSVVELFSTWSTSNMSKTYIEIDFTWYVSWFAGCMWLGNRNPKLNFLFDIKVWEVCKTLYYGLQRNFMHDKIYQEDLYKGV